MEEVVKKVRKKRTVDPMKKVEAIDRKIAALEAEKAEILREVNAKKVIAEAIKTMDPKEIAEKLGIELE